MQKKKVTRSGYSSDNYIGESVSQKTQNNGNNYTVKEKLEDVENYRIADLSTTRGIRKDICEKFGVRMSVSSSDGITPTAVYFPSRDQKGNITGYKKRDLTLGKHEHGHFSTVGYVAVGNQMFGQHEADMVKRNKATSPLYHVEGEFDHLSLYQSFVDSVKGTKYEGVEPFVVSINLGTANAVENVMSNIKFVSQFQKNVMGYDNDSATPKERAKGILKGKEATEAVAAALMQDNIFVVDYPSNYKDPNEMVMDGKAEDLQKLFSFCKNKFTAEKIVTASDISLEEIMTKREAGALIGCFPDLMDKIQGFRKRELVVLTSASGVGKSSVTSEISYGLAEHGYKVAMIFLEEETKETVQRMIARRLSVNYNRFKFNPLAYATQEQIREAYEWVCENEKFMFLDHFGSMRVDELMNKVKTLVHIHKVDYIILDHLTVLCGDGDQSKQTADLDKVMVELAAFVASNDVGVLAISHLNRGAADEIKNISSLTEPKWIRVKKESMRGTSSLEALSWIILGLDYELMPDRTRGRVQISVLKNRPFGLLGATDILYMDQESGRLLNASEGFVPGVQKITLATSPMMESPPLDNYSNMPQLEDSEDSPF